MNDDYDNHIVLKYRLAVALAIIKNTPGNSTPEIYLERLRNNILSEMDSYDPDMTICEDDFNLNDDEDCGVNDNDEDGAINDINDNNETQIDSQTNDSVTILKDFDFNDMMRNNNDKDVMNNSVADVLRILRGDDSREIKDTQTSCNDADDKSKKLNHSQSTYYESCQSVIHQLNVDTNENEVMQGDLAFGYTSTVPANELAYVNNDMNRTTASLSSTENALYDSQRTNTNHDFTDNFTHVSQSQVDNIVLPRYLIEKERPKAIELDPPVNCIKHNINADVIKTKKTIISDNSKIVKEINGEPNSDVIIISNENKVNCSKKHKQARYKINNNNVLNKRTRHADNNIDCNTDAAYLNEIKTKFNINASGANYEMNLQSNSNKPNEPCKEIFRSHNAITDSIYSFSKEAGTDSNTDRKYYDDNKRQSSDNVRSQVTIESNGDIKIGYNSQTFSQFSQEFDSEPSNKMESPIEITSITQVNTAAEAEAEEQIVEDLFDKLSDSQAEVVPFKVLEELNKVKAFLDKRNQRRSSECVSDSGYKSDSRSSFKSALQTSDSWLNQSAYCLLSYITDYPLVVNTEKITIEISRTLGRLIDRLHEDEKYPSFLDVHLQTIDGLLRDIYEQEPADKLLEKDESIHRLFLLNKSSHIAKYTTEKIITILEDVLTILPTELLETSRTIKTENLSYIFHILETLIKKLVVHRNISSQQSTQNSQDELVLKRSSITEIWRKKWNPDKKWDSKDTKWDLKDKRWDSKDSRDSNPIASVKQCVLVRCSNVLNKFIIQAMDGYSLMSYFALQCFNLLQN